MHTFFSIYLIMSKKVRNDYAQVDRAIKNAYVTIIQKEKRMPSQGEIAQICKINEKTVRRHLDNITLAEIGQPFKIFGEDVLLGLRDKAIKGDAQAAKLLFMILFDWSEKQQIEHKGDLKIIFEDARDGEDDKD